MNKPIEIAPRSGVAFTMAEDELLTVWDPLGGQVSDMVAYSRDDIGECLSNGRTFDYEETIRLTRGHHLWSNRSRIMFAIEEDSVGTHDFLLTPCSKATFRHFYPDKPVHHGCLGNLAAALAPYDIAEDAIPVAFNIFMNVPVDPVTGRLEVLPPRSGAGDFIRLRAKMDCIVGLTACSAYASNGGSFKPIHYAVN